MSGGSDINREYVKAFVPDMEKLAKYVNQAKGPERTMAEFAEACGAVSASTFSRIVNRKITRPLSIELIDTIIEHAANPDDVDREGFMRANGMVPKDAQEKGNYRYMEEAAQREARVNWNRIVKSIIQDELYAREHMLLFLGNLSLHLDKFPISDFGLGKCGSFAFRVQGYEPKYWNFIVYLSEPQERSSVSTAEVMRGMKRIMYQYNGAHLFLSDLWEPERFKDIKNSFVFTEPEIYAAFCEMFKKIKVNTWMSAILVDTAKREVVEEKMLPRHDGKITSSIFDEEKKIFGDDFGE